MQATPEESVAFAEPTVEEKPAVTEPTPQVKTVSGIPHRRFTSISISEQHEIKPIRSLESREAEMLTQERLEQLWKELVERSKGDEKLYELLADKKVELKNNNLFTIQVANLYFDSLFKNYQTEILGFLREKTNNEALLFKVVVVVEHVERKAYMPREKFEEMVKVNPSMLTLRKLFPDIDF
ncbi:MAG: hypothetical protein J6T88_04795 [Bacteroidales bacterium]|nr:hypothetical protein [Bacteroidales bacterium]